MLENVPNSITIDFISFTVPFVDDAIQSVAETFDEGGFEPLSYGGMGYQRSAKIMNEGRIFWHPDRPEMGVHCRLNAKSLALSGMTPVGILSRVFDWNGSITRLDIAFDDTDGLLSIDLMHGKILAGELVTRYRRVARITGNGLPDSEKIGDTINIGSRSSSSFVRIYNKLLEQKVKGKLPESVEMWVRVEIELKGLKASAFAILLVDAVRGETTRTPTECCRGLLVGLLDFKDPSENDGNKSRWPTSEFWATFVNNQAKLKLSLPKEKRSLRESKDWLQRMISPTLAMIVLSEPEYDGTTGWDFIVDCVVKGEKRLKTDHYRKLDEHRQAVFDEVDRMD